MSEKIFKGNDIIVYDDILNEEEQNKFETLFYKNKDGFPMYLHESYGEDYASIFKNNKNIKQSPQMTHVFFQSSEDDNVSTHFSIINALLNEVVNYFKLEHIDLVRAKANLLFQLQNNQKSTYTTPHIDSLNEHLVCIYYINDSDGDTHFFEEVPMPSWLSLSKGYFDSKFKKVLAENEFKITKSISPKKGRFLFFKGNILHANGNPIYNNTRMVMNIDFKI